MGKKNINKYIVISGFNPTDNNRGTAALGYGAISFLKANNYLEDSMEIIGFQFYKKFWKRKNQEDKIVDIKQDGKVWRYTKYNVFEIERILAEKFGILLPFTRFGQMMKLTKCVAAINGGDGFSDIYNTSTFEMRLPMSKVAISVGVPHIILPQTLGPFKQRQNYETAKKILINSTAIFVRDDKFVEELEKMNVGFTLTKDLSAFMQPEPWSIKIEADSIGINVSGLCYSNKFQALSGQFDNYPLLIDSIIRHFQMLGKTIYLIPHSYNFNCPESNNDDLLACKQAYNRLENHSNIVLIDKDLTSPQIKYVISKMSFFIGTRMHANFAAIYSKVPLFGLAYSYKFAGAFNANGLNGERQTAMINNLALCDIEKIVYKILSYYEQINNE